MIRQDEFSGGGSLEGTIGKSPVFCGCCTSVAISLVTVN